VEIGLKVAGVGEAFVTGHALYDQHLIRVQMRLRLEPKIGKASVVACVPFATRSNKPPTPSAVKTEARFLASNRARPLCLPASFRNAGLKVFYHRLVSDGKAPKVALVAMLPSQPILMARF
jgi:hypothetical protein